MTEPPARIGALNVLSTRGNTKQDRKTTCICDRGHKQVRRTSSLIASAREGKHVWCDVCGPELNDEQRDSLVMVYVFGYVNGFGPTTREVNKFLGKTGRDRLQGLERRGMVERNEWREWVCTERGKGEMDWLLSEPAREGAA